MKFKHKREVTFFERLIILELSFLYQLEAMVVLLLFRVSALSKVLSELVAIRLPVWEPGCLGSNPMSSIY